MLKLFAFFITQQLQLLFSQSKIEIREVRWFRDTQRKLVVSRQNRDERQIDRKTRRVLLRQNCRGRILWFRRRGTNVTGTRITSAHQ